MINSLFLFCFEFFLKRVPRTGISPNIGTFEVLILSSSLRTPVNTSVSPFLTLIAPVSSFLTLKVFCIPHPAIGTVLVIEEIAGLKAKVT